MPTRLRVDLAGYHHVINRGVNRCDISKEILQLMEEEKLDTQALIKAIEYILKL